MRSFSIVVLFAVACGSSEQPAGGQLDAAAGSGGAAGAAGAGNPDAAIDGASGAGCAPNTIPLIVEAEGGSPVRYWVPVEYEGKPAALGVDTGSALTFLFLPPDSPVYVPHAGDITLGCETLPVAGRNIDLGDSIDGLPRIGLLGADFFLSANLQLDAVEKTLTRYINGAPAPETGNFSVLAFDDVEGHIVAPVVLDSTPLRLMFDTGSPDIVWLGALGKPGDEEVPIQDASGEVLTFYQGPSVLEMAGEPPRSIDVLRAPSWPYFESTVAALGGNLHGLLGLNVFAYRKLVFRPDLKQILIAPEM